MGLTLIKKSNGKVLSKWYGRYTVNGQSRIFALCRWTGTPPLDGDLSKPGDEVFERSRARAEVLYQAKLAVLAEARSEEDLKHTEYMVAKHRLRTNYRKELSGEVIVEREADGTCSVWQRFMQSVGSLRCGARQADYYRVIVERFTDFVLARYPGQRVALGSLNESDVQAFMDSIEGLSAQTWNVYLVVLRKVFRRLAGFSTACDWLVGAKRRSKEEISREIFSAREIMEIEAMAERLGDSLVRSMVIIASCTGLRLKDICLLQWESVDFRSNTISLKTFKTGGLVGLPMWPSLAAELRGLWRLKKADEVYVLPDAAAQYERNPKTLLERLHRVLFALGYGGDGARGQSDVAGELPEICPAVDVLEKVQAALKSPDCDWTERRKTKALECVRRYLDGATLQQVAAEIGGSKSRVSEYISDLEKLTGVAIIRKSIASLIVPPEERGCLRSEKAEGSRARRASLRGWHSFRGSFVMAAKDAGADMDAIKKYMGSKTVEIILEHYIKATPQFMDKGIGQHVPDFALATVPVETEQALVNATPLEERIRLAVNLLKKATPKTWKEVIAQTLEVLGDKIFERYRR